MICTIIGAVILGCLVDPATRPTPAEAVKILTASVSNTPTACVASRASWTSRARRLGRHSSRSSRLR